jgi:hypothetical protein
MQAYIGSDESDADSTTSRKSAAENRKAKKKEEQRRLMREKLGLSADGDRGGGKEEVVGGMQITFTSGLGGEKAKKKGVFENGPQGGEEESTRDRYIRKEKERKALRKQQRSSQVDAAPQTTAGNDIEAGADEEQEDAGFNDPFFTDPTLSHQTEKKARKAAKEAKRTARLAEEAESAERKKELELLMADDQGDAVRHFDMRDVKKAEKEARRKGKKGKKGKNLKDVDGEEIEGDGFEVDVKDERFGAVFERSEYAIDPTNPRFEGTRGMKGLLEEGRKRKRNRGREDGEDDEPPREKLEGKRRAR